MLYEKKHITLKLLAEKKHAISVAESFTALKNMQ
jgi:nicotinamide mononucleotide (NMN) deamidase PncC